MKHFYDSKKRKGHLHAAIQKYGIDNFLVEEIDSSSCFKEISQKETYYIKLYNSIDPNIGYNLTFDSSGSRSFRERTIISWRRAKQGVKGKKNGTSKFIGVVKGEKSYYFIIGHSGKYYTKNYEQEKDAALGYDKAALFLFGPSAKINFPERKAELLSEDLKAFFESLPRNARKEFRIKYRKKENKWQVRVNELSFGVFLKKEEALYIADVIWLFLNPNTKIEKLNFPENLQFYKNLDLKSIYDNCLKSKRQSPCPQQTL